MSLSLMRGGSECDSLKTCHSAFRLRTHLDIVYSLFGFRMVFPVPQ